MAFSSDVFAATVATGNSCLVLRNSRHRRSGCFPSGTQVRILGNSRRRGYVNVEVVDSRGRVRRGRMFRRYLRSGSPSQGGSSGSSYGLRSGYNIRPEPNLSNTPLGTVRSFDGKVQVTGNRRGNFREVQLVMNGELVKAWVHRNALTRSVPPVVVTAPTPDPGGSGGGDNPEPPTTKPDPIVPIVVNPPGRPSAPINTETKETVYNSIMKIADQHTSCANSRSVADRYTTARLRHRRGYYHGMTLSFARSVCRSQSPIRDAMLMSGRRDVFSHYGSLIRKYGGNGTEKNLISLYAILLPHGLRESSGDYREGVDIAAGSSSQKSNSAEAGLCQTSYDVAGAMGKTAARAMRSLEDLYANNKQACMTDIFKKGLDLSKTHSPSIGSGAGRRFQELMRSCPALAAEHCAITSRNAYHHYGPYKRKESRPFNSCYPMLEEVYAMVNNDRETVCDAMAIEPKNLDQPAPFEDFQVAEGQRTTTVQ